MRSIMHRNGGSWTGNENNLNYFISFSEFVPSYQAASSNSVIVLFIDSMLVNQQIFYPQAEDVFLF